MSIKSMIVSSHPVIRNTLLIIPLLLVGLIYFLREGIAIDSLKIGQFHVEGLYLKLHKKLDVRVEVLSVPSRSTHADPDRIDVVLERMRQLPLFFDRIALDAMQYGGKTYRVIYRDSVLYVDTRSYEIAAVLSPDQGTVKAEIPLLHLKKFNTYFTGSARYDYRREIVTFSGDYDLEGVAGTVTGRYAQARLHFQTRADSNGSIRGLLSHVPLKPIVTEWLTQRIRSGGIVLEHLEGDAEMVEGRLRIDWMSLKGQAYAQNVTIRFHDRLQQAQAKRVDLTLKNNVLYAALKQPRFHDRSLKGTTLYIANLFGKRTRRLHLDLRTISPYDTVVANVLGAYGIVLPFVQTRGELEGRVVLDFPLVKKPAVRFSGRVAVVKPGAVLLSDVPFRLLAGEATFDNARVTLSGVRADTDWINAVIEGPIDYPKRRGNLRVAVQKLALGEAKDPFLVARNLKRLPVRLSWNDHSTTIGIDRYHTTITLKGKGFDLACTQTQSLVPYLRGIPLVPGRGTVSVHTPDGVRYDFHGETTWPASYLYDRRGPIRTIDYRGRYNGKALVLDALKGKVHYDGAAGKLRIHHLNIDAKKMMDVAASDSSSSEDRIWIVGHNTLIRYDKYVLMTDRFDFRMNGKNTTFVATKDGDHVHIERNGNMLVVKANRIKAPMLRALIHFGGLKGGRYSLDLHGDIRKTLHGVITIQGGTISEFKTYNNMIALFNTVPSLASLSDPGFSREGFEVRKGRIEFRILSNRIFFDMIYIDGKSAAISGKGTVSTLNGAINMDLAVRTARTLGKIIGSLPVVGYILMGKDKSVTTGVKVTGTLENPKVETHIVLETLLSPFEMFVRTIKSPAHIINK